MEGGHVTIFLPEDEEKRVEKFGELGEVVPPTRSRHLYKQIFIKTLFYLFIVKLFSLFLHVLTMTQVNFFLFNII